MQHDKLQPLSDLHEWKLENSDQDIRGRPVTTPDGQSLGTVSDLLVDRDQELVTAIRLNDGRILPAEALKINSDRVIARTAGGKAAEATGEEVRIPIVEERIRVGKRVVESGGVRVTSRIEETPVHEDVRLREERVVVETRPVDQPAPAGENLFRERTLEATATSEEAVVAKEARVAEEVVVRKEVTERTKTIDDVVRHTEVEVDDTRTRRGDAEPSRERGLGH